MAIRWRFNLHFELLQEIPGILDCRKPEILLCEMGRVLVSQRELRVDAHRQANRAYGQISICHKFVVF